MSSIEFRRGKVIKKGEMYFVLSDKSEELKLGLKHWHFPRILGYTILFDGKAERPPRNGERVCYRTSTYDGKPIISLAIPLLEYEKVLKEIDEPRYQIQKGLFMRGRGLVFRIIGEGTLAQIRRRFSSETLIPVEGEEYRFYIQDPPVKCGPWKSIPQDPR